MSDAGLGFNRARSWRPIAVDDCLIHHRAITDSLYASVVRGLGDCSGNRIIDAYAGIGVLAVELAARAQAVVCIESSRATARMGVLNARLNDAEDKVTYVLEPVEEALPRLAV